MPPFSLPLCGQKGTMSLHATVIVPCKNEGANVQQTLRSMLQAKNKTPTEFLLIDDGSTDNSFDFLRRKTPAGVRVIRTSGIGSPQARNLGAKEANGEIVLFCDGHIRVPDGWIDRLSTPLIDTSVGAVGPSVGALKSPDHVGYGITWNNKLQLKWLLRETSGPVPSVSALCIAMRRKTFLDVGGFDEGYRIWGHQDMEIGMRLWLMGYKVFLDPSIRVLHLFRSRHPYQVTAKDVDHNLLRMAVRHFSRDRLTRVLKMLQSNHGYAAVVADVLTGDASLQRRQLFARRRHDDDWYMNRFTIPF